MKYRRTFNSSKLVTLTCCMSLFVAISGPATTEETTSAAPLDRLEVTNQAQELLWGGENPADPLLAREFLQIQAQKGSVDAMRILGQQLVWGWVIPQDAGEGRKYLEQAIQQGDDAAMVILAQGLLWADALPFDPNSAQALLEKAVASGNRDAKRILGEQLVGGWRIERDVKKGTNLLERAISLGDNEAKVALGKLYFYGVGVSKSKEKALELFESAALAGLGEGLAIYGTDMMWGLSNPKAAETYLNKAGELGETAVWATLAEGAMYGYLGPGSVSRAKFDRYAEKAREAGDEKIEVLEADRNMWGISMTASGPETIGRLRKAADNGNSQAARYLVELLRDGNRMNLWPDRTKAREALETYSGLLTETQLV